MFRTNRKRTIAGIVVTILAITAGAAAYWTAGGTGTGSATTGTTSAITVNQTTVLAAMYPGDSAQTISGTFTNANSGPIHVDTITPSVTSTSNAGCTSADFTIVPALVNATAPVGTGVGSWSGPTIKFNNNTGANQDACKGVTVNLAYTIS